ncbi:MAG: hypothetical protein IPM37_03185 [Hahellaceae bacterium]|nr:hypothetical protein [Hahellaceae bacterium]
MIYRLDDLFETVEKAQNPVWLVTFSKDWNLKDIATFRERYARPRFESEDHTIDVFYILPNKQQ